MALSVTFHVHNVVRTTSSARVEYGGSTIVASVPCTEIELVSTGLHGSVTLRFTGAEAEDAATFFSTRQEIIWTL